jgi:hypothetical protein
MLWPSPAIAHPRMVSGLKSLVNTNRLAVHPT